MATTINNLRESSMDYRPNGCVIRFSTLALMLLVSTFVVAHGPARLLKQAPTIKPETCGQIENIEQCHQDYLTGCTASANPRYDAYLNYLKNQNPKPTVTPAKNLTQKDFEKLDRTMPADLKPGHNAEHANELAALGQGAFQSVVGYLYVAFPSGVESTNCQLKDDTKDANGMPNHNNVDYHIHIGFDSAIAERLRGGWKPNKDETHGLQQQSVIVEMTPHYRAWNQPNWTIDLVTGVMGRQVKVVGQLLADNEHIKASDSCAHPNADKSKCWRASIWELHPVTEFYVCGPNVDSTCSAMSPNWMKLKDLAQ